MIKRCIDDYYSNSTFETSTMNKADTKNVLSLLTPILESILEKNIAEQINASEFTDKRVVIKGCGDIAIPEVAYVAITNKLRPVVKSIMYGEPCSTVPIYKKKV